MIDYDEFAALSQSRDSDDRVEAALLIAKAYLAHVGPADEHAALYAVLVGFLDDPSVKVRAALAYGLLHARETPRTVLLSLLQDAPVIARALAQYSPALTETDLLALARTSEMSVVMALASRDAVPSRLAAAILDRADRDVLLGLLTRHDIELPGPRLLTLARNHSEDAVLRGALLARLDLPAAGRLVLTEAVANALRGARIVHGALQPERLEKHLRDAQDAALAAIGENESAQPQSDYAATLVAEDKVSTRVMLHAVINGHVLFFADCIAELSGTPRNKVFTLLESGSRVALNALISRCGVGNAVRNVLVRLIFHARTVNLADDVVSRHLVVTAITEEILAEFGGAIPADLEAAFAYLSEQNVDLARQAARNVMGSFWMEQPALPAPEDNRYEPAA